MSLNNHALPFTILEYQQRLKQVRQLMSEQGIELLLVSDPANMCYLHGYTATWYRANSTSTWPPLATTAIHVASDKLIHFDQIEEQSLLEETSIIQNCRFYPVTQDLKSGLNFLIQELKAEGWLKDRAGLEWHSHIPNRWVSEQLQAALLAGGISQVVDGSFIVRSARRIKSPQEIEYIKQAAHIADIGHQAAQKVIRPGLTESEVFGEALRAMLSAGGELPAINQGFKISASPHAYSGRSILEQGAWARLDVCGVIHRYHANVSRNYWLGEPPAQALKLNQISAGAFDILREEASPGVPVAEVNRKLRQYFIRHQLWEQIYYIGGYELGIAFPPDWVGEFMFDATNAKDQRQFEANLVTNFESIISAFIHSAELNSRLVQIFNIDTVVYTKNSTFTLSALPLDIIIV